MFSRALPVDDRFVSLQVSTFFSFLFAFFVGFHQTSFRFHTYHQANWLFFIILIIKNNSDKKQLDAEKQRAGLRRRTKIKIDKIEIGISRSQDSRVNIFFFNISKKRAKNLRRKNKAVVLPIIFVEKKFLRNSYF